MTRFAVDPFDLLLALLRDALPDVNVRGSVPDEVPDLVPLVVIRRIGGSSPYPDHWDEPLINVQCWAAADGATDATRAASNLADQVRGVLWTAWRRQTVTPAGHISFIRESQAPQEIDDVDLPFLGRFAATYELFLRNPRTA